MEKDYYSEIGHLLRAAREEKELTLDQAADRLHIRPRYLHALEQGRFDELPGGIAYVKGYLRTYAVFLRLDRKEILRRFIQVEDVLEPTGFYLPQVLSRAKNPSQWAIWGGCILALLFYVCWQAFLKPQRVDIVMIESVPKEEIPSITVPALIFAKVACLGEQESYYPPCHVMGVEPFNLLPPQLSGADIVTMQQEQDATKKRKIPAPKFEPEDEDMWDTAPEPEHQDAQ